MTNNSQTLVQQKMQALKAEYIASLPGRKEKITVYFNAVEAGANEPELFIKFRQVIHGLAGSGGTFGYREISDTAMKLEHLVKQWIDEAVNLNSEEILKADSLVRELCKLLDELINEK